MVIEFHDDHIENGVDGSLRSFAGRLGTIEYAYQAEMWIQDILGDPNTIRRAYAIGRFFVHAIWAKTPDQKIHYIAKSSLFNGRWELPHLYPERTQLVTILLGREVKSWDDAQQWVIKNFGDDIATIVLFDVEGLLAAWEKTGDNEVTLIAKNARPQRKAQAG